jgi:hypothetical protein
MFAIRSTVARCPTAVKGLASASAYSDSSGLGIQPKTTWRMIATVPHAVGAQQHDPRRSTCF